MNILLHIDSVEYIYIPFTTDVEDPGSLTNPQLAFTLTESLGDTPTWISANIVQDEPEAGMYAIRILFGTDWQPNKEGTYWWWAKFTDNPESPIERGPSRIEVYS